MRNEKLNDELFTFVVELGSSRIKHPTSTLTLDAYGISCSLLFVSGNPTSFGIQMPHFQRSGQTHTISIRSTDFYQMNDVAEEVESGPAFILQSYLWSSLPKHLKKLQLAECQVSDSQIGILVRALHGHETIEVSVERLDLPSVLRAACSRLMIHFT